MSYIRERHRIKLKFIECYYKFFDKDQAANKLFESMEEYNKLKFLIHVDCLPKTTNLKGIYKNSKIKDYRIVYAKCVGHLCENTITRFRLITNNNYDTVSVIIELLYSDYNITWFVLN